MSLFFNEEKRIFSLSPSRNKNPGPGSYTPKFQKFDSSSFNIKEIPFSSKTERKVFEPKPDYKITQEIDSIDEKRPLNFETEILKSAAEIEKIKRLKAEKFKKQIRKGRSEEKKIVSKREKDEENKIPDPGCYYKDPVKLYLRKIESKKKKVRLQRAMRKKLNSLLKKAKTSPSIPNAQEKYMYHYSKGNLNTSKS